MDQSDEPKYVKDQIAMVHYLRDLMDDYRDRAGDWPVIRGFHGVFLTLLERGSIKWTDTAAIEKLKNKYIHNHKSPFEKVPPQPPLKQTPPQHHVQCTNEASATERSLTMG